MNTERTGEEGGRARTTTMHRCVLCLRHRQVILTLEAHSLDDRVRDILDRHLLVLADRENERLDVVVVAQLPDEELREVARVDELAEGLA